MQETKKSWLRRYLARVWRGAGGPGVVEGARYLEELRDAAFAPPPAGRVETFAAAVARLGLTDADLAAKHAGLTARVAVAVALAGAILAFGVVRLAAAGSVAETMIAGITTWCAVPVVVLAGTFRFRAWQVENRSLRPVRAWLSDPAELAGIAKWLAVAAVTAAGVAALFTIAPAAADTHTLGHAVMNPAPDDQSVIWLRQLFGEAAGGTQPTGLSQVIGTFNAALFAVATAITLYIGGKAAVDTATHGAWLGRQSNTAWGVARIGGAALLLVPAKGGFTLLQVMVVTLATWGIGLANVTWRNVTELTAAGTPLAVLTVPNAAPLARGILENLICVELVNHAGATAKAYGQAATALRVQRVDRQVAAAYGATGDTRPVATADNAGGQRPATLVTAWDGTAGSGLPPAVCGSVDFGPVDAAATAVAGDGIAAAFRGNAALQKAAVDLMIERLIPVARGFAHAVVDPDGGKLPARAPLLSIMQEYSETISARAAAVAAAVNADAGERFRQVTQTGGWTEAGAWWMRIGEMNRSVHAVANVRPGVTGPQYIRLAGNRDYAAALGAVQAGFPAWWNVAALQTYQPPGSAETRQALGAAASFGDIDNLAKTPEAVISRAFPTNDLFAWLFDRFDNLNDDAPAWTPAALMDTGQTIINMTIAGFGAYAGARVAAAGVKEGASGLLIFGAPLAVPAKIALELFQTVSWWTASIMSGLLVIGVTLAYVVPFMPFFHFLMSVVGWVILVAEAVVAAGLWALAHLRLDGDGLAGPQGASGYFFLLNVFIRPVYIVLSLVLAIAIFSLVANYYSRLFFTSATAVLQDIGPIDALAALALYTFGLIALAGTVYAMVGEIADRALRWIGGQAANFSDHGVTRDVEGKAVAAAAVLAGRSRGVPAPRRLPSPKAPATGTEGEKKTDA